MRKVHFITAIALMALLFPVSSKAASIVSETEVDGVKEYVISPDGSEDASALITECLQSNGNKGVKVTLSPGDYSLRYALRLYSNTTLIATGATITQTTNGRGLVTNGTPAKGKYNSIQNIVVDGGTWIATSKPGDGAKKKSNGFYPGFCSFLFYHGQNITIQNCSFKNNYNGHYIEFSGIKNGKILNCNMDVKGSKVIGEADQEAIQIDNTYAQANAPSAAPWDDTPCVNITIDNCKIRFSRGIGTNRKGNAFFENIKITNSTIITTKGEGINAYDIKGLTITGNTIDVKHKTNNYLSTGVYVGLDSKISNWGKYSTTITNNKITGYRNGLKIYSLSGSSFNKVTLQKNTIASRKSQGDALSLDTKHIKKLVDKGNKLKKAK